MNGTIYMPVGEVCSSISDTYREKKNMVTLINTSDVLEGRVLNHERVPNSNLKGQFKKTFQRDDILYSEIRPQNRRFAYVDFSPIDYIASTKLMVIRAKKDVVSPKYLYYFLKNSSTVAELQLLAETRSGTFPQITFSEVANLTIPVPSLAVQEVIVQTMQCLEDKITCNEQINDNLQQQAAALFESWFVNYDPWDGVQPSEWENAPLGSFVEIKRGGSPRPIQDFLSDSGLRWLKISDVTSLSSPFVLEIKEHIKEEGLRKTVFLHAGELVLSNSATPGIPKILDVDTCIHDGWLYFPKSELSKYYLYLFFKHIRKELVALGNGSVFTNLKTDILKAFPATKADESTLKEFDALVTPLFDAMLNADRENFKLAAMRDALLPKLMSSEIDVSEVEL